MRLEDARAAVGEMMPGLLAALNLGDWHINVIYSDDDAVQDDSGNMRFVREAQVNVRGEYMHAGITIFFDNIDTVDRLRLTLVHECIHITQWPFWHYTTVVGNLLAKELRDADESAYTHAIERHVQEVLRWPSIQALFRPAPGPGGKGKGDRRKAGRLGA